jgi:hypothetical protein
MRDSDAERRRNWEPGWPLLWHPQSIELEPAMLAALPLILEGLQALVALEANTPGAIIIAASISAILQRGEATPADEQAIRAQLDAVHAAIDAA